MPNNPVILEEAPANCFIAHSFTFTSCPCGCGNFKLVGFDAGGVARAIVAIGADQLAEMTALLFVCAAMGTAAPPGAGGTKH